MAQIRATPGLASGGLGRVFAEAIVSAPACERSPATERRAARRARRRTAPGIEPQTPGWQTAASPATPDATQRNRGSTPAHLTRHKKTTRCGRDAAAFTGRNTQKKEMSMQRVERCVGSTCLFCLHIGYRICAIAMDTLAEQLRRRPAKPMGSPRVGSNPTGVG